MNDENLERKNTKRNGIILGVIGGALVLGGILSSYAFFQAIGTGNKNEEVSVQAGNMELIFADGNNGFEKVLEFGQSAEKTFTIKNNGSLDAIAKINWKNIVNTYLSESLTYSLSYMAEDDNTPVEVITNKSVPSSAEPATVELANGLSIPAGKTYTYTLTITLNYLDEADQTADLKARLSTEFSIEEGTSSKAPEEEPIIETGKATQVLLSKKNDVSVENYETANKGEMFTFDHEATEQTLALTDYRYVGTEPKNYIHFNDETWRIIGVFPVQSEEDGEYEQRIKIIREESFTNLVWDTENKNDWPNSSLSGELNSYYYSSHPKYYYSTGLTEASRNQISPAKWYLGGTSSSSTAKEIYIDERGTTTCIKTGACSGETRSTNTIQNVSLMYQSDFMYSYQNESVNENDSWLRKSSYQWTITAKKDSSSYVSVAVSNQTLVSSETNNPNTSFAVVRPVVYLRPDIEILSGSGAQDDMYELKPIG